MKKTVQNPEIFSDRLIRVKGLTKRYARGGIWSQRIQIEALSGVSFEIQAGKTLALVGESGSGKSTVARCVARLEKPDSGEIWVGGRDVARLNGRELLPFRAEVQLIFQDAVQSMNPRFSAREVVEEPLLLRGQQADEREATVRNCLSEVGLSPDWGDRPVMQFSGGQRQRLAIARALTIRPKVLILDEAVTGLDVSTQAEIANLLLDLQSAHALTYLLISHDLRLVARMADGIAVISGGQIKETGTTQEIMSAPKHEETARLLLASQALQLKVVEVAGARA